MNVRQAAGISVLSNSLLVILKLVVGIIIGSVSVISEAIHSGIDLLASLIAFFAVKQSSKPADEDHPYGHGKFENISGTIEAILIFIAAIWIIWEAVHKFQNPSSVDAPALGIIIMFISAIINIGVSEMLFRVGKKEQSIALEADAWHLRTDVYTSLGVMAGLFLMWILKYFIPDISWNWIDPTAAIFVAILIIKAAYELTVNSAKDLFDVGLPKSEIDSINAILASHPNVKGITHLKTRKSGKEKFIEFNMLVSANSSVIEAHNISDELTLLIKKQFDHCHVMIHIEPHDFAECSN